jgi:hypothetical protein
MSVHVSSLVYRARLGSAARKAVALKLADCAHDDGSNVYPSIARIANEAEVSDRTVQRVLKSFVKEGLLVIVERGGKGPRDTTEYRFALDQLVALAPVSNPLNKGDKLTPINPKRVTGCRDKGDTVSSKGDRVSPDPSRTIIEPSISARERVGSSKSDLDDRKAKPAELPRFVSEDALDKVRSLAPGWDRQFLLRKFIDWDGSRKARDLDAAFLAWVPKFTRGKDARAP